MQRLLGLLVEHTTGNTPICDNVHITQHAEANTPPLWWQSGPMAHDWLEISIDGVCYRNVRDRSQGSVRL